MGQKKYANGFKVTMHPDTLEEPLRWTKPCRVFVCSMSDLFHRDVTDDFIRKVFEVMNKCPQHTFQLCTKRPLRMANMILPWSKNIWAGTTVESADQYHRIDAVRRVPAVVNWLSVEPMLGPMPDMDLTGIAWLVCGAESGPGARYMQLDWARQVRDQCVKNRVAFFLKQLSPADGGKRKPVMLDGQVWEQYPTPVPF
jgi:protein gp37